MLRSGWKVVLAACRLIMIVPAYLLSKWTISPPMITWHS
jgi:hypothetical protein